MRRTVAVLAASSVVLVCVLYAAGSASARVLHVRAGGRVPVTATGYAPGADITIGLAGGTARQFTHADRVGTVHAQFPAPSTTGRYRLLVVGTPAREVGPPSASGAPASSAPTVSVSNLVLSVPRIVPIDFRVTPSSGADAKHVSRHHRTGHHHATHGADAASAGGDGLADTGTDVAALLMVGAVALLTGGLLLSAGRRARRDESV